MTTEQATRAAIVSAIQAFCKRVEQRAYRSGKPGDLWAVVRALDDELAALERAAQAEGAPEGGSQVEETADGE